MEKNSKDGMFGIYYAPFRREIKIGLLLDKSGVTGMQGGKVVYKRKGIRVELFLVFFDIKLYFHPWHGEWETLSPIYFCEAEYNNKETVWFFLQRYRPTIETHFNIELAGRYIYRKDDKKAYMRKGLSFDLSVICLRIFFRLTPFRAK